MTTPNNNNPFESIAQTPPKTVPSGLYAHHVGDDPYDMKSAVYTNPESHVDPRVTATGVGNNANTKRTSLKDLANIYGKPVGTYIDPISGDITLNAPGEGDIRATSAPIAPQAAAPLNSDNRYAEQSVKPAPFINPSAYEAWYNGQSVQKVAPVASPVAVKEEISATIKAFNAKLDDLTKKITGFDSSINQAIKEAKVQQPAVAPQAFPKTVEDIKPGVRYEHVFSPSDLQELDNLLTDLETVRINRMPPPAFEIAAPLYGFDYTSGRMSPPVVPETINQHLSELEREALMSKRDGWITEPDGTQKSYRNGKLHNDTGPAEIRTNGTHLFYKDGKLHRDGGLPAMSAAGGTVKYAVNGKYHRLGGQPAITWSKSPYRHEWWENGVVLRAIKKDGTQEWYAPGSSEREKAVFHRKDGPAVIHPNGREEYWLNGNLFRTRADWEVALNAMHTLRIDTIDRELLHEDPIDMDDQGVEFNTQPTKVSKQQEKKMSKPSLTEIMKKNAGEAAYRIAATQSTSIVKNALLAVMKNNGADNGALASFGAFLDTEYGASMISLALGTGLNYVPVYGDDPRVQKLGEEMRINGMATFGNAIIGEAMQHVLPALTEVLNKLPAVEESNNVRLEETKESRLADELEEDEVKAEETSSVRKTLTA